MEQHNQHCHYHDGSKTLIWLFYEAFTHSRTNANEYVKMANEGEMSVLSMMQDIEKNTDVRFDEMNKNLVKKMGV